MPYRILPILLWFAITVTAKAQPGDLKVYSKVEIKDDQTFIDNMVKRLAAEENPDDNITWNRGDVTYAPDNSFRVFYFEGEFNGSYNVEETFTLLYFDGGEIPMTYRVPFTRIASIDQVGKKTGIFLIRQYESSRPRASESISCQAASLLKVEPAGVKLLEVMEDPEKAFDCYEKTDGGRFSVCSTVMIDQEARLTYDAEKMELNYYYPDYVYEEVNNNGRYCLVNGTLRWNGESFRLVKERMEVKHAEGY